MASHIQLLISPSTTLELAEPSTCVANGNKIKLYKLVKMYVQEFVILISIPFGRKLHMD